MKLFFLLLPNRPLGIRGVCKFNWVVDWPIVLYAAFKCVLLSVVKSKRRC